MGKLDLTYNYRGTRRRNGRHEAVIGFTGPVVGTRGVTGSGRGTASFDLEKGQFSQVRADVDIAVSLIRREGRRVDVIKASGNLEIFLDRDPQE
jgi:hypothetical protein